MDLKLGASIHNRFDIRVIRDGKVIQEAYAENIVLDRMYTRLCAFATYFDYIQAGTGTGALAASRTALFALKCYKAASTVETIYAVPLSKITRKIQINPEEYVGSVFTEVGISDSATYANTHALIKDAEGVQISITKTAIDLIEIYATVYIELQDNVSAGIYWHAEGSTNTILNYLVNLAVFNTSSGLRLGVNDGFLMDNLTYTNIACTVTGNSSAKTITWPVVRFPVGSSNQEIGSVIIDNTLVADITKNFAGQDRVGVSLGTGDGAKVEFIVPDRNLSNLVVKVDGVVSSDYVVSNPSYLKVLSCYKYTGAPFGKTGSITLFDDNPGLGVLSSRYIVRVGGREIISLGQPLIGSIAGYTSTQYCTALGYGFYSLECSQYINGNVYFYNNLYRYDYITKDIVLALDLQNNYTDTTSGAWFSVSCLGTFLCACYYQKTGIVMKRINSDGTLSNDVSFVGSPISKASGCSWISDTLCVLYWNSTCYYFKFDGTVFNYTGKSFYYSSSLFSGAYGGVQVVYFTYYNRLEIHTFNPDTGVELTSEVLEQFSTGSPSLKINTVGLDDYIGCLASFSSNGYLYIFKGSISKANLVNRIVLSFSGVCRGLYYDSINKNLYLACADYLYVYRVYINNYSKIVFNVAPTASAVITADYHIPHIHKTTDYVIDVGVVLQLGEGVV